VSLPLLRSFLFVEIKQAFVESIVKSLSTVNATNVCWEEWHHHVADALCDDRKLRFNLLATDGGVVLSSLHLFE